jgi:hypothetical protein
MKKEIIVPEKKIISATNGECDLWCDYFDPIFTISKYFCKLFKADGKSIDLTVKNDAALCCPACIEAQKAAEKEK